MKFTDFCTDMTQLPKQNYAQPRPYNWTDLKRELKDFLNIGCYAAKVSEFSQRDIRSARRSIESCAKRFNFPIRAVHINGELWLINTSKEDNKHADS